MFITENIRINSEVVGKSHNPIDVGGELAVFLASGGQHHSIASHQSQGESAKQLTRGHTFFKTLTPSQSSADLLHLCDSTRMKAIKSLHGERKKNKTLLAASNGCWMGSWVLVFPLLSGLSIGPNPS